MPYGYRGHMGSGITLSINDVNRDVGCSYYRHPWRGLDGITTDVTPLKIVGLNNYS